jgi:hypothetical protein
MQQPVCLPLRRRKGAQPAGLKLRSPQPSAPSSLIRQHLAHGQPRGFPRWQKARHGAQHDPNNEPQQGAARREGIAQRRLQERRSDRVAEHPAQRDGGQRPEQPAQHADEVGRDLRRALRLAGGLHRRYASTPTAQQDIQQCLTIVDVAIPMPNTHGSSDELDKVIVVATIRHCRIRGED